MTWRLLIPLILLLSYSCKEQKPESAAPKEYPNQIGDIAYDAAIDDPDFERCNPDFAPQQYRAFEGWHEMYEGDKSALRQQILSRYQPYEKKGQSGYYTTRFLVNCQGTAGLYRTESMGLDYQPISFHTKITNQIDVIIKELDGWQVFNYEGRDYDYYAYIIIKLKDGQIERILP